jgi:hypothetical protein
MGIKELMWENVDWIYLTQDGVKSLAVMEREKNRQVQFTTKAVYFLSENVLTFKRYIARRRFVVTCTYYTKKVFGCCSVAIAVSLFMPYVTTFPVE